MEYYSAHAAPPPGVTTLPHPAVTQDGVPNRFNNVPYEVHEELLVKLEDPSFTHRDLQRMIVRHARDTRHTTGEYPVVPLLLATFWDQNDPDGPTKGRADAAASFEWKKEMLAHMESCFESCVERLDPLVKMRAIYLPHDHPERLFVEALNTSLQRHLNGSVSKTDRINMVMLPNCITSLIHKAAEHTLNARVHASIDTKIMSQMIKQYWAPADDDVTELQWAPADDDDFFDEQNL